MASTTAAAAPRAVTLKGPSTNSKTYFIALPDTLEDLIEKAKRLFPIPPDKTPIITLGNDERAILLQETMPFVRDREPLVFRWVAATPKRQLGNRVRWDDPSSVHFNANAPSSSIGTPSRPSLPHLGKTSSLRLYSPVARAASSTHTPLPPSARANRTQPRDPSIRFGDGVNARQAHARRILSEQREKEARRQRRLDEGQGGGSDVEMSEEDGLDVFESPTDEPTIDPIAVATTAADTATCENAVPETAPLQPAAAADALLLSPPRKRHPDSVALDTPPSSGSRSSSPYRSLERKKATELQRSHDRENEEQASSPIQSPTRELSAVRQKAAFSITDITNALIAGSELKRITERGNGGATKELAVDAAASGREQATDEGVKDKPVEHENAASGKTEAVVDVRAEADSPVGEPAAVAAARIVAPPATKGEVAARHDDAMERAPALATVADAEVEKTYRYIDNLILQLVSHGSNSVFREPMTKGYLERLPSNARPVDLFTMRQAVQAKEYGSSILADGVKACRAVMLDFETDLAAMYANARRLYGVKSAQAQCADTLEKFSSSFIDEWKRSMDKKPSRADEAVDSEGRKMAMLRQQLTPTKRGEKRGALPGMLPFAFNGTSRLLFPSFSGGAGVGAGASRKSEAAPASAQSTPTTLSAKKQLASENPGAIKRNTSHDGQMDASTAASRRARFSATSNELERSMLDGPFRDFFAQSRTRPTPSAASSNSSRQANPLAAFERALRGPDPAPDSAPVFATATDSAVAVAFAVAAKEVDASAAPHKPVQQQQQNDQVPMAVGPERHEAAAAIQSMEEDLLTPPVSIVEATKEADTMSRTDKQPEQPEQPDVSMAVVAEQESSASETVEKAADVAADAAKGDSRPSEAPSTDDDAAEPTASAPTGGATEVSTAPCSSFDVAAPSPPLQHVPASLGGDEIDQAVKAVLQRAERESSLDSLHSSTESLNAPSAPFPTASGKKGKKRGRPTRAEAAAKMAAAAAAAACTSAMAVVEPTTPRRGRCSVRLSSVSPTKATAQRKEVEMGTDTRKSKRQRTVSSSSSAAARVAVAKVAEMAEVAVATPPPAKGRKGRKSKTTPTSTPTPTATPSRSPAVVGAGAGAGSTSAANKARMTSIDLTQDADSDDDLPLRVQPIRRSASYHRAEEQEADEEEVRGTFDLHTPSATSTVAGTGREKQEWSEESSLSDIELASLPPTMTTHASGKRGSSKSQRSKKRKAEESVDSDSLMSESEQRRSAARVGSARTTRATRRGKT